MRAKTVVILMTAVVMLVGIPPTGAFSQNIPKAKEFRIERSMPKEAMACIDCHKREHPGLFSDWARSRHASANITCYDCHKAEAFDPDVIILDDAFQHLKLAKDLDLVLMDAKRPFGNGYLFPRGILREPPDGLERCDAIILTRAEGDATATLQQIAKTAAEQPIFKSLHIPKIRHVIEPKTGRARSTLNIKALSDMKSLQRVPVLGLTKT